MISDIQTKIKNAMLAMQRFSWEQGLAAQALWEIGEDEMALLMAREAVHRSLPDGRIGVSHAYTDAIDCGANALPVYWAYQKTGEEIFREKFNGMIQWFKNAEKSADGIVYHNLDIRHNLIDGVYHMAPPMALAGETEFAMDQIRRFRKVLLDPETKLYHQVWSDELNDFERKEFWGCGVGWMLAALSLTGLCLPLDAVSEKDELSQYLKEGIDAFCKYRREDGLTGDILDDPDSFSETAALTMVAYAIYRGIQAHMLPDLYLKEADSMTDCFMKYVDENGLLQLGCDAPVFNRPGVSTEDQAFVLMCLQAQSELKNGKEYRFKRSR